MMPTVYIANSTCMYSVFVSFIRMDPSSLTRSITYGDVQSCTCIGIGCIVCVIIMGALVCGVRVSGVYNPLSGTT